MAPHSSKKTVPVTGVVTAAPTRFGSKHVRFDQTLHVPSSGRSHHSSSGTHHSTTGGRSGTHHSQSGGSRSGHHSGSASGSHHVAAGSFRPDASSKRPTGAIHPTSSSSHRGELESRTGAMAQSNGGGSLRQPSTHRSYQPSSTRGRSQRHHASIWHDRSTAISTDCQYGK
ncbi:hypothetical protein CC86DRAFT_384401 [Ophiobolus disseminans]|uniref:Uncharacterized protein n=1 Tax=Ophiobolus disseminans TaxID=1469910 RepID=A0A6A6ZU54_9PLEO|nr:hypothetical protein CC86DRAFT_384401 [Ophiobolus disseminans]